MRYFLLIYFFSISFVNAQKINDMQYEKAVDFVTCICMNVVLKSNNDCKNTVLKLEDIPADQSASIVLFEELQSLKKEKNRNVDFLANDIFISEKKFQKIHAFTKKNKQQLDEVKSKIKEFLVTDENQETVNDLSDSINKPLTSQEEPKNQPVTEAVTVETKETNMELSYIEQNLLAVIIGITLIILIVCVIFKNNASKKELEEIRKKIDNRPHVNIPNTESIKNSGNLNFENAIQMISNRITELENNFKILNQKSIEQPVVEPIPIAKQEILKQEPIRDIFYMSVPNENGTFDVSGNTSKESALYEFIVDTKNPLMAEFRFIATDSKVIQSVVDYSQSYINPACDAQNALNQNAKRIITIYPGTAEKRNDKWIIITKSQIKYE